MNDEFNNRYDDNIALQKMTDERCARIRWLKRFIEKTQERLSACTRIDEAEIRELEKKELSAFRELLRLNGI